MIKRKSFAKLKEVYPMPHLLDIQTLSYEEFLQRDIQVDKRSALGLQEAFLEVFPIERSTVSRSVAAAA
jgi:DNA-directed RNA polymerase subunit beta